MNEDDIEFDQEALLGNTHLTDLKPEQAKEEIKYESLNVSEYFTTKYMCNYTMLKLFTLQACILCFPLSIPHLFFSVEYVLSSYASDGPSMASIHNFLCKVRVVEVNPVST